MSRLTTCVLAALLVGNAMAQNGRMGWIEMGRGFPELALPTLEENRPQLMSAFRGKRVILHVFASW